MTKVCTTRTFIMLILIFLFSICLSGCTTTYRDNFEKEFRPYLKYSLGKYESKRKKIVHRYPLFSFLKMTECYQWSATFKNDKGEDKKFIFHNSLQTSACAYDTAEESFAYQVRDYAATCIQTEVRQIVDRYITPEEYKKLKGENWFEGSSLLYTHVKYDDKDLTACLDLVNGLKLSGFTANELYQKWNLDFQFNITTSLTDEEELNALKLKIEKMMREFYSYLGDDTVEFLLQYGRFGYQKLHGVYQRDSDTFNWIPDDEYLDEINTIDGRLMIVNKIFINGEKLPSNAEAYYNSDTNEYEIMLPYLTDVLRELGIKVERTSIKDANGIFVGYDEWIVVHDTFRIDEATESIIKNGEIIKHIPGYSYNKRYEIYLGMSLLSALTGAEVYFDESKNAIAINSLTNNLDENK